MANEQKDVRVRFSAEGIAEVVSAFQKISSEGKKSAKETGGAFAELKDQFTEVGKSLLAGLSIVYAADKLKELFKQTLENAEALTRLSAQTGLSTATIQAFGRAARETGIGADSANAGIQKFTAAVGKAQLSSGATRTALSDLQIDLKSFSNLSPDEKFQLVAERLASIPDPARRARDELALFSKGGIELDQALVKVGEEGIGPFIAKLKELGLFLDQEAINNLLSLKERLRDLHDEAQGLGQQFILGLVPGISQAVQGLTKASSAGEGFKAVGKLIGDTILFLQQGFQGLGIWIGAIMARASVVFTTYGQVVSDVLGRDFKKAREDYAAGMRQIQAINEAALEDQKRLENEIANGPKSPEAPEARGGGGGEQPPAVIDDSVARARVELIKARLENELKLFEAHDKLLLAEAKSSYDNGQISLQEYFAKRAEIIAKEYDKQIAIAQAKLKAEESLPVSLNNEAAQIQKATKEEQLKGQIAELNAQRQAALQQNNNELHTEELQLTEKTASAQEKLLQIEGKKTEAARVRLKIESEALDRELKAGGVAPGERQAAVSTFLTKGGATIDYQDASDKAKADLSLLESQKKSIQDEVNSGQIFAIQGEERMQELERQRLPLLQQDAQAMLDFANTTKDPQLIASAEAFKEKIQEIGVGINQSSKYMKEMRDGVQQAVGAGFNTFLTDAIINSKSLGEAFHNAAKTMLADLARMAIQIEEEQFLRALFSGGKGGGGLFGLFGSGGFSVGLGGSGSVVSDPGFASGGYVRGPGSTTSDSIPARLSDKEYIVSAQATQRPGVLSLLDAINGGLRVPQFASGGYVSSVGGNFSSAASAGRTQLSLNIAPEALHYTMRDWLEREIADAMAKR